VKLVSALLGPFIMPLEESTEPHAIEARAYGATVAVEAATKRW